MQEEITQKTLALCVETGKMTAQLLQQAMKKVLADIPTTFWRGTEARSVSTTAATPSAA